MPTLPAPFPFLPSGGDLPVSSVEDVLAVFPARLRETETAPVRDAIAEAAADMFLSVQERTDEAAAQSDPTRATGKYLDGHASDRKLYRQDGENDEALRDRIFTVPAVVTPAAIIAAVKAILAPYTTIEPQLFESVLDRMYLRNDSTSWGAFLTDGATNIDPVWVRRYALRPNGHPGGAWAFADADGRYFILRVPPISNGSRGGFVFSEIGNRVATGRGLFLGDGTDPDGSAAGFLYDELGTAESIYQQIINTVQRLRGHGIRWLLVVDPKLT